MPTRPRSCRPEIKHLFAIVPDRCRFRPRTRAASRGCERTSERLFVRKDLSSATCATSDNAKYNVPPSHPCEKRSADNIIVNQPFVEKWPFLTCRKRLRQKYSRGETPKESTITDRGWGQRLRVREKTGKQKAGQGRGGKWWKIPYFSNRQGRGNVRLGGEA